MNDFVLFRVKVSGWVHYIVYCIVFVRRGRGGCGVGEWEGVE